MWSLLALAALAAARSAQACQADAQSASNCDWSVGGDCASAWFLQNCCVTHAKHCGATPTAAVLFSKAGCGGQRYNLSRHSEGTKVFGCSKCFDVCWKKFDGGAAMHS